MCFSQHPKMILKVELIPLVLWLNDVEQGEEHRLKERVYDRVELEDNT